VAISNPRYYWDTRSNLPTIEFSVLNGSKRSISRIHVSGQLTQSGRFEKWTAGGLSYKFDRSLEAGEQTSVRLATQVFSAPTTKQLQALYDTDIAIKVTNVEDADGNKLVPIDVDVLDGMRNKRNFLREDSRRWSESATFCVEIEPRQTLTHLAKLGRSAKKN
jgi:hypothetical protein